MEHLPFYVNIIFFLTTGLTVFLFYKASHHSLPTLVVILLWLIMQGFISSTEFYTVTNTLPPRFALLVAPPILLIAILFFTKNGRLFIDRLNLKTLTLLHIIRIPVEVVLLLLFLHKAVPKLMTFEGRNFDILSGLSAPVILLIAFTKGVINKKLLLVWNSICLVLLINIVVNAVLSAPFVFQQFGFEQPNIALLYFPFVWLPCCIVPLVLLSHFAAIRQLVKSKSQDS